MKQAFLTPQNRKWTFILLGACTLLALGAALVGIDDNLPGLGLAFLSACALVLAFTHPWRSAKLYRNLFLAALLTFFVSVVLHNLLETGGVAGFFSVIFFFIAILLCPAALLISIIGFFVMLVRAQRQG